jgi:YidC/Oxa1 family membrane protein insertase
MQLNPKQPDPVQQQIFSWMPVMFTFLLASFPAGLVIYWAWSNTLSLAQQYFIMKRQGAEIHLMGNISNAFKTAGRVTDKAIGVVKPKSARKGGSDDDDSKGKGGRGGSNGKRS